MPPKGGRQSFTRVEHQTSSSELSKTPKNMIRLPQMMILETEKGGQAKWNSGSGFDSLPHQTVKPQIRPKLEISETDCAHVSCSKILITGSLTKNLVPHCLELCAHRISQDPYVFSKPILYVWIWRGAQSTWDIKTHTI